MLNNRFKFLKESISTKENSFQFIKYCELTENQLAQILKFGDLRNLQLLGEKNGGGGFPCGSEVKASACNMGDLGQIPALGRFPWRRKWQPTQVPLPGKSHGERSLVGCSPWGCKELDMTQQLINNNNINLVTSIMFTFSFKNYLFPPFSLEQPKIKHPSEPPGEQEQNY